MLQDFALKDKQLFALQDKLTIVTLVVCKS